jgi:hypothetical protein
LLDALFVGDEEDEFLAVPLDMVDAAGEVEFCTGTQDGGGADGVGVAGAENWIDGLGEEVPGAEDFVLFIAVPGNILEVNKLVSCVQG